MISPNDPVRIVGAGIAGTWSALMLAEAGRPATVFERGGPDLAGSTSHWAGGMLAPDCEAEGAEPIVVRLGKRSLDLWQRFLPDTEIRGSLVVCHPRDSGDLDRFGRQTAGHETLNGDGIGRLEPMLARRFGRGLFFSNEGHVEPRIVLPRLRQAAEARGSRFVFETEAADEDPAITVDCRGLAARDHLTDLRGVKGETVLVESADIELSRPVRLIHPRWPLYVIPRSGGRFLIGATTIESEDRSGVSVRSALELMTAAYTIHPAFGEARILEIGSGLRPAFPDNAPRIEVKGRRIAVNGLYRHGFLLAPALGEIVANYVVHGSRDNEAMRWS